MIYDYRDVEIAINGTGLLIDSATLSINPRISPIGAIGMTSFYDYAVDGNLECELTINYIPEVSNEPNYSICRNIRFFPNSYTNRNFTISYANISGNFYLKSYAFNVSELNEARATATYVCYNKLSGDYATSNYASYDAENLSGIAHAWSTYSEKQNGDDIEIINFSYNFDANIKPFYRIGNPYPHQVSYFGSNERYDIVRDRFTHLNYSGDTPDHFYNGLYKFRCAAISGANTVNTPEDLTFIVDGCKIINQDLTNNIDGQQTIKTTLIKNYD